MSKNRHPTTTPSQEQVQRGYQPQQTTGGDGPNPQGGHTPTTGQSTPHTPPSNPPNQGSGGKK